MIKREIKGPSWIKVHGATRVDYSNMTSWCKIEAVLSTPKGLLKGVPSEGVRRQAPPFTVASISLKTIVNPATHQHEVVAAGDRSLFIMELSTRVLLPSCACAACISLSRVADLPIMSCC